MHYKTIVLNLLEDRPRLMRRLKRDRQLLATLETYALELKTSHETWRQELFKTKPGSAPEQLASEALELALADLQDRLPSESENDEA